VASLGQCFVDSSPSTCMMIPLPHGLSPKPRRILQEVVAAFLCQGVIEHTPFNLQHCYKQSSSNCPLVVENVVSGSFLFQLPLFIPETNPARLCGGVSEPAVHRFPPPSSFALSPHRLSPKPSLHFVGLRDRLPGPFMHRAPSLQPALLSTPHPKPFPHSVGLRGGLPGHALYRSSPPRSTSALFNPPP
jgi:hypothetical protein